MSFIPYGVKAPYKYKYLHEEDKRTVDVIRYLKEECIENLKDNLDIYYDDKELDQTVFIDGEKHTLKEALEGYNDCMQEWIDMFVRELMTSVIDGYEEEIEYSEEDETIYEGIYGVGV